MIDNEDLINARRRATSFKRGIYHQMELFKLASNGSGDNNWDLMCDAIENIKSDVKDKFLANGYKEELRKIEKIIFWYRTLENRYVRPTEDGPQLVFPPDIKIKLNRNIRIAYELIVKGLNKLGYLE